MTKDTTETAASPATGADGAGDESLALDAVADQLASLSVSDVTKAAGESESTTRPKDTDDVSVDDPDLWKPGPPPEDCPVCMIPLPIENTEKSYFACCGKTICSACNHEHARALRVMNDKRKKEELPVEGSCAFCRTPYCNGVDFKERCILRMEKNDCMAYFMMGSSYLEGSGNLPKNNSKAFKLLRRAAELGSTEAMVRLGIAYTEGSPGIEKDLRKACELYKKAAKGGNLLSRFNLGSVEFKDNNHDLAIRHWRLAAEGGDQPAMKYLWGYFYKGILSKPVLEETLRAHQDSVDERNSEDRERRAACERAEQGDDEVLKRMYRRYYQGMIKAKELKKELEVYSQISP